MDATDIDIVNAQMSAHELSPPRKRLMQQSQQRCNSRPVKQAQQVEHTNLSSWVWTGA